MQSQIDYRVFLDQIVDGKKCLELWRDKRNDKTIRTIVLGGSSEFARENEATFRRVAEDEITSTKFMGENPPTLLLPFVMLGDVPAYVFDAHHIKTRSQFFGNKIAGGDGCDEMELKIKPLYLRHGDEIVKATNAQVVVYYIPDNDEWLKIL